MIGDALQIITKAIDLASELRDMKVKDAEAQHSIADLYLALADIKMKFVEAQERITQLECELKDAHKMPDLRDKLQIKHGVYYFTEPVPGRHEGPYCPTCLDAKGTLVTIAELPELFRDVQRFHCNNCKGSF